MAKKVQRKIYTAAKFYKKQLVNGQKKGFNSIANMSSNLPNTSTVLASPISISAYINSGAEKCKSGDYKGALEDYDKAIEVSLFLLAKYNRQEVGITSKNNFRLLMYAIAIYDKIIDINSRLAQAYLNRGLVKDNFTGYGSGIADYEKASHTSCNLVEAYFKRGNAKYHNRDFSQAIADYTNALKINPNFFKAYIGRGIAEETLGNFVDAIRDYDKALELSPDLKSKLQPRIDRIMSHFRKDSGE